MGARRSFGPELAKFIQVNCVPVVYPGGNSVTIQTATGQVLGAPKPGWVSDIHQGPVGKNPVELLIDEVVLYDAGKKLDS